MPTRLNSHHTHGTRSKGKRLRQKETSSLKTKKNPYKKKKSSKKAKKTKSAPEVNEPPVSKQLICPIFDDFFDDDDDDDGEYPVSAGASPNKEDPVPVDISADKDMTPDNGYANNVFDCKTPIRDLNVELDQIVKSIEKHQATFTSTSRPKLNMQTTGNSAQYSANQVREVEKFVCFLEQCKFILFLLLLLFDDIGY